MRFLITITILFLTSTALGGSWHRHKRTVHLQPGECIKVGNQKVCAVPQQIETEPTSIENIVMYCSLEKYGANTTKMWVLYQASTTNKGKTRKTRLKAFPHFEGSECKNEATRIGG